MKAFTEKEEVNEELYTGEEKKFIWFLEHLVPCNDKIRGV
jgi:hypothetical protein